jgi:hypothetical protein
MSKATLIPMPGVTPPRLGPPPLRIHHFFIVTAVSAVVLALNRAMIQIGALDGGNFFSSGNGMLAATLSGVAVALVGLALIWRLRGRVMFQSPGHWMLLGALFFPFLFLLLLAAWLLSDSPDMSYTPIPLTVYSIVLFIGWPVLNFIAAWKGFDSRWWRWYFLLNGAMYFAIMLLPGLGQFLSIVMGAFQIGMLFLIAAAVKSDLRNSRNRDWVHWVGVGMVALQLLVATVNTLWA